MSVDAKIGGRKAGLCIDIHPVATKARTADKLLDARRLLATSPRHRRTVPASLVAIEELHQALAHVTMELLPCHNVPSGTRL